MRVMYHLYYLQGSVTFRGTITKKEAPLFILVYSLKKCLESVYVKRYCSVYQPKWGGGGGIRLLIRSFFCPKMRSFVMFLFVYCIVKPYQNVTSGKTVVFFRHDIF